MTDTLTDPAALSVLGTRTQDRLELVPTVTFYAPETEAELGALGIDDPAMRYVTNGG